MPITTDDWSYRYQEMKAKLEQELRYAEVTCQMLRDIIGRQEKALTNMKVRNINLRHQLDDYDQLNAAFENVRMERDELQESNDKLLRRNRILEEDVRQLEEREEW